MSRFADLFVALCIVAVSASIGIVMYYQMDLSPTLAVTAVIALAVMLLIVNVRSLRLQDRTALNESIESMTRRLDQVTSEFDSLERRISAIESGGPRRARQDLEPVVAEVEVIGALIRQVVETVADLEVQLASPDRSRPQTIAAPAGEVFDTSKPALTDRSVLGPTAGQDMTELVPKRFKTLGEAGFLALIKSAIDANRIDLHLQPIVTLPQRKVRFYETLTRLRTVDGETIYPTDYLPLAEKSGLMPALDNQIVLRTVQILRRLTQRSKDIGVFCNVSATSLGDGHFFAELYKFLEGNTALADDLVFEFTQSALKVLGPMEFEGLRAIQGLGFKFSLDRIRDMRSSFQFLSERGFRYAKIAADRLLSGGDALQTDIHAADLASYFSRFGIDLIADHIETESQVVDILDFGLKFGQGFLFAPPRPVKSDLSSANSDAAMAMPRARPIPQPSPAAPPVQRAPASAPASAAAPVVPAQTRRGPALTPPAAPPQTSTVSPVDAAGWAAAKARQTAGQSTNR